MVLVALLFGAFRYLQSQTKKASPESTLSFEAGGSSIEVFYNRPSKKGRAIFGELVPFGKTWRTGANEATTFSTSGPLSIGGQTLPAGKYTLWTVPEADRWTVIWNSKMYPWGVSMKGEASREAEFDVLKAEVPVKTLPEPVEMFTIAFEQDSIAFMTLSWDRTQVRVPIQ